jgi:hypothetical protein
MGGLYQKAGPAYTDAAPMPAEEEGFELPVAGLSVRAAMVMLLSRASVPISGFASSSAVRPGFANRSCPIG